MSADALADLERAEEVVRELGTEVARALRDEHISDRVPLLADEAARLVCRSLDGVATALSGSPTRFPVCANDPAFVAATRSTGLSERGLEVLRARQVFVSSDNAWIARVVELNRVPSEVRSKKLHNGPRVTVRRKGGGEVVYNSSVKFGPGVNVCGAEIDPKTQLPVPTPGVTVEVQNWGSLVFADGGENVVEFLRSVVHRAVVLVVELCAVR